MAIQKEKKQQMVAGYLELLSKSKALILTDYRGSTVAGLTALRTELREVDGVFQVVKNSLFERALKESGMPVPEELLKGPVAIGYCLAEVPPVAKKLVDFAKASDALEIQGAVLGDSFLSASDVKGLADLPPREILLAQLLGTIQSPMSSLVSTIAAPMRELVQVLKARSEQGEEAAA